MKQATRILLLVLASSFSIMVEAQDDSKPATSENSSTGKVESPPAKIEQIKEVAGKLTSELEAEAQKLAKEVDQIPQAKTVAAGILQPVYLVAEALAFPAFHWLAFALMSAGVFSYALQLLLGKLVVLMRLGFSFKEIASDTVGLAISVIGLVLTTQAAAENSNFTQSPAAVISATVVGGLVGIILYFWGQSQELEAVAGRTKSIAAGQK